MLQPCVDLSLLDALSLWISGQKLDGNCICGLSTTWIGRLAKFIALLGAMPIIFDIIGEERIVAFGSRATRYSKNFRLYIDHNLPSFAGKFVYLYAQDWVRYRQITGKEPKNWMKITYGVLITSFSAYCVLFLLFKVSEYALMHPNYEDWWGTLIFWMTFLAYGFFVIAISVLYLSILSAPYLLYIGIRPIEIVLQNPRLCWLSRVISVLLILTAFCFDMITS